jgi:hypothetical protein
MKGDAPCLLIGSPNFYTSKSKIECLTKYEKKVFLLDSVSLFFFYGFEPILGPSYSLLLSLTQLWWKKEEALICHL